MKTLAALALVAAWPLVTIHCNLEVVPGFAFLACCDHADSVPHQDNDCDTDDCAEVEGGLYKLEESPAWVTAPVFLATLFVAIPLAPAGHGLATASASPDVAPPELAVTWRFVLRAALPPRAPSSAS